MIRDEKRKFSKNQETALYVIKDIQTDKEELMAYDVKIPTEKGVKILDFEYRDGYLYLLESTLELTIYNPNDDWSHQEVKTHLNFRVGSEKPVKSLADL